MFTVVSLFDTLGENGPWPLVQVNSSFTVVEMKINSTFMAIAVIHH